jgi:hypothetical protein
MQNVGRELLGLRGGAERRGKDVGKYGEACG